MQVKLNNYQIVCEIGRGGMAVVHEAIEIPIARRVALKILPTGAALDPRQTARFHPRRCEAIQFTHRPNRLRVAD